jgi:transposase
MHKTREILRQKWLLGRTHWQTATSNGTSPGAVGSVLARAKAAGLTTWEQVTQLDDEALERTLYGAAVVEPGVAPAEPDCAWIHRERRRPQVTLELLHLEYLRQHPNGLRYTAFCNRYRAWLARRGLVMRQVHVAGEKMFVDYAGKKPTLVEPATGTVTQVELFVAVLGASSYTYAEATRWRWDTSPGCINPGGNGLSWTTAASLKLGALHAQMGVHRGSLYLSHVRRGR